MEEKEIREPNSILKNPNNTVVIIASQYINKITDQLIGMKLVENEHLFRELTNLYFVKKLNIIAYFT